jgi:protein-histidine pros-kinase
VDCKAVIDDVATTLRPQAQDKGLAFTVNAPEHPVIIRTDRRALSQIVFNLAGNAIKFTERGSVMLTLCVDAAPETGLPRTIIRVDDTGVGIPLADHDKLFGAFSRINTARPNAPEGTGLGLHLSQKLAELLGGKIVFRSESGEGSSFSLVLAGV